MVDRGLFFGGGETLIKPKVETRTYILGFVMQYNSYLLKNLEQGFSAGLDSVTETRTHNSSFYWGRAILQNIYI